MGAFGILFARFLAILAGSVQAHKIAHVEVASERPVVALPVDRVGRGRRGLGNFRSADVAASETRGLFVGCVLSINRSGFQPTGSPSRRCPREVGALAFCFACLETIVCFLLVLDFKFAFEVAIKRPKYFPAFRLRPFDGRCGISSPS